MSQKERFTLAVRDQIRHLHSCNCYLSSVNFLYYNFSSALPNGSVPIHRINLGHTANNDLPLLRATDLINVSTEIYSISVPPLLHFTHCSLLETIMSIEDVKLKELITRDELQTEIDEMNRAVPEQWTRKGNKKYNDRMRKQKQRSSHFEICDYLYCRHKVQIKFCMARSNKNHPSRINAQFSN